MGISIIKGLMGSGMSHNFCKFDIIDSSFITLAQYRWLKYIYPEYENIEYSYILNRKKEKIYFIKDDFKNYVDL